MFNMRTYVILVSLFVLAAGCGGSSGDSSQEEETEIANAVEQTVSTLHATATQSATPRPTPTSTQSLTPLPTPTSTQLATLTVQTQPSQTPTSTTVPTSTATPTETLITDYVSGCGGSTVSYYLWELGVKFNLDQWNRLVDSANLVIEAWNHWVTATSNTVTYDQATGNQDFIDASDNFLVTADRERANIVAETIFGEFSGLASSSVNLIDAQKQMIWLFKVAANDFNVDAWNSAIDEGDNVDIKMLEYDSALSEACSYWESR